MAPVLAAVILVFLGYIALWTASQNNIPAGISKFGRIMSIILFVFAGLVLVFHMAMRPHFRGHGMMGKMGERHGSFMRGQMGWHKDNREEMTPCCDKGQMDEKAQTNASSAMSQDMKNKK
ncbi:MAG: hypothetical protein ABSH12_08300 [Endomicrobiales bacterium]|jgi:hypothetical protein